MAQGENNDVDGVLGGPIEIVWRSSKTKPDEGAKQARDLTFESSQTDFACRWSTDSGLR